MELSDLLMDVEEKKIIGLGFWGAIIGGIAEIVDFDNKVINHKYKFIFNNPHTDLDFAKTIIALATGMPSVNYGNGIVRDGGETLIYISSARIGYEIGSQLIKSIKGYVKK